MLVNFSFSFLLILQAQMPQHNQRQQSYLLMHLNEVHYQCFYYVVAGAFLQNKLQELVFLYQYSLLYLQKH